MTKSRKYRILALAAGLAAVAGATIHASHNDFGLGRNMEITVNMMRELSLGYVDPIDPDRLMEGAAAGMVSDLDPYTEYISEEGMSDFELLTTGKYGGVGALIRKKGDWVVIAQPYQGTPSDRAGLRIGDRILEIDGRDARGFTTEEVSSRLKGEPGSRVKVTVLHLDSTRQTVTLHRERIAIPGVPYAGWAADGIGYIRHSDFTEGCYEEMRAAVERLRAEGGLKGLILDYRSNGGGIMQEAVKILSMFVPKGTAVVTTKGRNERQDYRTESEPILPDLPLAVLVNGNTASASEIVAGALQDLDRAVLIGQRSFGKGLVQTDPPAGLQHDAQTHRLAERCASLGPLHPGHRSTRDSQEGSVRVVPVLARFREATDPCAAARLTTAGGIMPDIATEPEYISALRRDALRAGLHRGFRRRPHAPPPGAADRPAHLLDHRTPATPTPPSSCRTRRFLRVGHAAGAGGAEEGRRGRPLRRAEGAFRAGRGRAEGRHADQPRNLPRTGRRCHQQRHRAASRLHRAGVIEHALPGDREVTEAVAVLRDSAEYARITREQDTRRK